MKRPFELILSVLALVGTGALGLIGVYIGNVQSMPLQIALAASYGIAHPALAYALWNIKKGALIAAKVLMTLFLISSFFLYEFIEPLILIVNSLIYVYTLMYLFRPDIREAFKEG